MAKKKVFDRVKKGLKESVAHSRADINEQAIARLSHRCDDLWALLQETMKDCAEYQLMLMGCRRALRKARGEEVD